MHFGSFNEQSQPAPMAEINVTPMVDVMLVLLVIFMIAAPLFTHALQLELPSATSEEVAEQPDMISIAIDANGQLYWQNVPIDQAELTSHLEQAALSQPQPEILLRADKATRYDMLANVMSAAQSHGLSKLGFVTDPKNTR